MAIAVWQGPPRSYTKGRIRPIQYVVVHYTAGSEGPNSAEAGAAYDKVRTDGTSTHVFVDSNSVVREVLDGDRAHACFYHGNNIGLQMEICGTAQTREQWLDKYSLPTLQLAAKQTAEWCRDYGLPVRRLTVAETRAAWYAPEGQRPRGIVGHVDVTQAYPEDGGDHTDPGKDFPWDVFLGMVKAELGEESDVSYNEEQYGWAISQMKPTVKVQAGEPAPDPNRGQIVTVPNELAAAVNALKASVEALHAKVDKLATGGVDKQTLVDAAFEGAQRAEKE